MDATANTSPTLSPTAPSNRSAPAMALPRGTRLHEFELSEVVGEGGFSIVYAAHDTRLQRPVAIKEYIPSAFASRSTQSRIELRSERHRPAFDTGLHSFIDEARLLARFKHPSLVEVLRFWEGNGTAYMAMPLYEGHTLRHILREHHGQYSEDWLRNMISPILDVLEMLHQHDIYHRDVAPDNIIVRPDGSPVLLDLGSARRVLGSTDNSPTVIVKPGYTPIEQYAENAATPQGPWTDAYALGALLYLAVTGSAPAASVSRLMKDTLEPLAGKPLAGYSEDFLRAIDQTLALQPGDRPQSIQALRTLLGINGQSRPQSLASTGLQPAMPAPAGHGADDAKTVILSAEEMLKLRKQLPSHGAPSLPDPFGEPAPRENHSPSQPRSKMPELDGLLSGASARSSGGSISVPSNTSQPEPAPITSAAASEPSQGRRRPMLIAGIAAAVIAVCAGAALLLWQPATEDSAKAPSNAPASLSSSTTRPTREQPEPAQPPSPLATRETPTETPPPALQDTPRPAVQAALQPEPLASNVERYTPPAEPAAKRPEPAAPRIEREQAPTRTQAQRPRQPVRDSKPETAASGTLSIAILPWGEVWIDGKKKGVTPPLLRLELPAGTHAVEIRNPGFPSHRRQIRLSEGQSVTLQHSFQ
ncbi:protein kinase domain-containing protein [Ectopseudomonas khazarica]|uniref:protein kinase domain-containing protein n=1 Tax=Ectopseudomonas khazarica TaxID=2502979 RepID=UPI004034B32C